MSILTKEIIDQIRFLTPPENQGQMVTYSYGIHPDATDAACIVERRTEGREPAVYTLYIDPEWEEEDSDNLDFWDDIPELGDEIETVTDRYSYDCADTNGNTCTSWDVVEVVEFFSMNDHTPTMDDLETADCDAQIDVWMKPEDDEDEQNPEDAVCLGSVTKRWGQ